MQKTLLWAIAVVVILGGAYILWQYRAAPAPSATESGAEASGSQVPASDNGISVGVNADVTVGTRPAAIITYSDAGFSPSSVTIKKGQAVQFVNDSSSQEVWPASAVHPTHAVYPEKSPSDCFGSSFDACRGLKRGESWDFTFNSVGEWKFHDHLHPSRFGSVTVTQ